MDPFYMIAMAIAIIVLIIILTVIGVMLSYKNTVSFPPSQNACPDYWTETVDNNGKIVCTIDQRNQGTFTSTSSTPGYNASNQTINFKDPGWGNTDNSSATCSLKKWANTNYILWDGVSNYNGCK
jgi:hypothetical protein